MQTAAAERMRRMRAKRTAGQAGRSPLLFERDDWRLLIESRSWPQKAGCQPGQAGRVIIKELVENALDSDARHVELTGDDEHCVVIDDGSGIAHQKIPQLFAVNRPLLSSKLKRLPTRGMLGHGLRVVMGAVAAYRGEITVASRGREFNLKVDITTGGTSIIAEREVDVPGTRVTVRFDRGWIFDNSDFAYGRRTIAIAASSSGVVYTGLSQAAWYTASDLHKLCAAAPKSASVANVLAEVFGIESRDERPARSLTENDVKEISWKQPKHTKHVSIGSIGEEFLGGYYRKVEDEATIEGAGIPVCVEAWIDCKHAEKDSRTWDTFSPIINRGISLAELHCSSNNYGLRLWGCGLEILMPGAKRANYDIDVSIIAPYVRLTGDGKAPYLGDFRDAIEKAVKGAAGEAYRNMVRPPSEMWIKEAAYAVMRDAYLAASNNGRLPAKARQIMYRARGPILQMTGKKKFSDTYFTQTLLPDYMNEHVRNTASQANIRAR